MPPTEHAILGASSAHRWIPCAGSVALEAQVPKGETSIHAAEGTVAHNLAEHALTGGDVHDWVGDKLIQDGFEIEVTEEMAEYVQEYVDHCEELKEIPGAKWSVEQRLSLKKLGPPAPMFGTGDFVALVPRAGMDDGYVLHVVDLKYGRGVVVEVDNNPQLRYYGLGAVLALGVRPEVVRMTVVQPRAFHADGTIRSADMDWDELKAFKDKLLEAGEQTVIAEQLYQIGDTDSFRETLNPGDHCRWCDALPTCPAQKTLALETAQSEFDEWNPPTPATLTPEELSTVLEAAPHIRRWLDAVEDHAKDELDRGREIPDFKLVEGRRGNRRWVDEDAAETYLRGQGMLVDERFKPRKLITPTQAEKILKEKKDKDLPDRLITQSDGKPTLAPADDKRPALPPSAQQDFDEVEV